jgi:hypothetical protein
MASYRYWQDRLGRSDFTYGQFGENLTVDGLPDDEVCIGDHYRIGSALFEVTQPRVTCYYLERENGSDGRQRRRGRRLDCGAHLGPRRVRHLRYPSGSTLSQKWGLTLRPQRILPSRTTQRVQIANAEHYASDPLFSPHDVCLPRAWSALVGWTRRAPSY